MAGLAPFVGTAVCGAGAARGLGRVAAGAVAAAVVAAAVLAGCSPPTAPPAPSGLTASGRTGRVVLDWEDGPSTVVGYRVARSSTANGTYTSLTPEPITASTYHDTGAP